MAQFGLRVGSYKRIGLNFFSSKTRKMKHILPKVQAHTFVIVQTLSREGIFLLKQEIMYVIVHNFYMRLLLLSKKDSQKEGVIAC